MKNLEMKSRTKAALLLCGMISLIPGLAYSQDNFYQGMISA
jgi:hypothetical protein